MEVTCCSQVRMPSMANYGCPQRRSRQRAAVAKSAARIAAYTSRDMPWTPPPPALRTTDDIGLRFLRDVGVTRFRGCMFLTRLRPA